MLRISNLNKKIKINGKEITILHDINLIFPKKGLFFIKGKSGSGKTTFLNILEGLDFDYGGEIYLNNKKIRKNKFYISSYLRNAISILFQDYNLNLEETALDNVIDGLMISGHKYKSAKRKSLEYLEKYNLNYLINKKCKYLSGGEKQRVALIRALSRDSKIIFCDEPTGALDNNNAQFIMGELKKISKNKLVIVVSHNEEITNKFADKVYKLNNGTFVEQDISLLSLDAQDIHIKNKGNFSYIFLKDLKYSLKSNIVIFITFIFAFSLLIGTCVIKGEAGNIQKSILNSFINSNNFELIYQNPYKTTGDVTIYSEQRPNLEQLESHTLFKDYYLDINFDYIFSNYARIENYDFEEIYFYPILGDDFYVNQAFIEQVKDISLDLEFNFEIVEYLDDEFVQDIMNFSTNFSYKSYEEFAFNLSPRVYYPYLKIKELFKSQTLQNLSIKQGSEHSLYDYIYYKNADDIVTSYSLVGFSLNDQTTDYDNLTNILKSSNLVISSDMLDLSKIYSDTLSSLVDYFLLLIVVCFAGIIFIIEFKLYETIQISKKRIKIYEFQGMQIEDYKNIKVLQTFLIIFITFIISLCINWIIFSFAKTLLQEVFKINVDFTFNSLIPFLNGSQFYIFLFLLITGIVFLGSLFSLNYLKKIDIKKELNSL